MMSTHAPIIAYTEQLTAVNTHLRRLMIKRSRIGWARFACIVLAIAAFYYLLPAGPGKAVWAALVFVAVFIRLVVLAVDNNAQIDHLQRLKTINENEISINAGDYYNRAEGKEWLPELHDYAYDLDIMGKASLYQYLNRTTSEQGNRQLAHWLLAPAGAEMIERRQEAVKELAKDLKGRQQLQAFGMAERVTISTEQRLKDWVRQPARFIHSSYWKWMRFVLPGLICFALVLNIAGILVSPLFYGCVFIFFLISGAVSRKIMPDYQQLNRIVSEIQTLSNSVAWIEKSTHPESPLLKELQQAYLAIPSGASGQVNTLKLILDRLDIRLNPFVFIPLNIFLFWDLQQIWALENWREKNRAGLARWFSALAEWEALASLGNLCFNHPDWAFPSIEREGGHFSAADLGHPLIAEKKRVTSSFTTTGRPQVALVTGSNMAGKSTFLRSVGINIVLAMAGAPVCATRCRLSPMRVISSMRIADNLAESTSTFYAELKKLKYIIDAVNAQEPAFLLLDEILRGTNSLDRHTGSRALIGQLIRKHAVGILATHDLELAALEASYPHSIRNYHFDVQVEKDELYFDYRLKNGVCKSMNASILMKKIGIEL